MLLTGHIKQVAVLIFTSEGNAAILRVYVLVITSCATCICASALCDGVRTVDVFVVCLNFVRGPFISIMVASMPMVVHPLLEAPVRQAQSLSLALSWF